MKPGLALSQISLFSSDGNGELLQSGFWGAHKERFHQTPYAFQFSLNLRSPETEKDVTLKGDILVLERPFMKVFTLGYIPHGPVIREYGGLQKESAVKLLLNHLHLLAEEIRKYLPSRMVFARFDLPWSTNAGRPPAPLVKAPVDIQPASTVVIDLHKTEEQILKEMKSKTRYNVRLSAKKGVSVEEQGMSGFDLWYGMYRETAERDRITIHSPEYYRSLFELADSFPGVKPKMLLLIASAEGRPLAGIVVSLYSAKATYLYGASRTEGRNLMPAYALQWEAMRTARASGCREYDLFGIPPDDDPSHPMHGLYRFKTGFGGSVIHRLGCWDMPFMPGLYRSAATGERFRGYYFKRIRKGRM